MPADFAAHTDLDLLRAIAAGDGEAFMAMYDRYRRLAFGLALRVLDDPSSAEEVVQDAFMQVWSRSEAFDSSGSANVRGWLMTIVHHRAIDTWRRTHRHADRSVTLDEELQLRSLADTWEDVDRHLTQEEMRQALDGLPDDQRRAIELAYFGGLTQSEIATHEDTPLGTVKGRMRLGLNKLRTSLTTMGDSRITGQG